jgi:hypothetical protein
VQFEDSTILEHKYYSSFKSGKIINYVGETVIANNGQKLTIIAFRNFSDIDLQFEDGTVLYHKRYPEFKKGTYRNPNFKVRNCPSPETIQKHIGQTSIAKNGQTMTIVAYRDKDDLDIQFEDGNIVRNKAYSNFLKGRIANKINIVGEVAIANNGQKMTIIAYRKYTDIDIEFEDGTIVYNKQYSNF